MIEQLKARYEQYRQESEEVLRKASPTDGLFGFGEDPRKNPCHDRFYEDVARWVREFAESNPSSAHAEAAVDQILRAPSENRDTAVFWYMYAAQKHAAPLIPLMSADSCAKLRDWYDGAYPKIDRMPVQKEIYKLLRKGAKTRK